MLAAAASWPIRNARSSGVIAAMAAFTVTALQTMPPEDLLHGLAIFLPALEAALPALLFAIVRDEERHMLGPVFALLLWGGVAFAAMWLLVAITLAGIDAYVRLGAPPVFQTMP
ncbi:hypothetical protein [Parvibaculum sp.]|jgi:hypothetical protein|uniref:hypothetical protein n=1 Tax=Parvibaculum sp. TaxID=2024848 RepID=UPI001B23B184|nr:hypothetical protein [Parvibaculum sp.]MBO6667582.1 hypothetical protein [Parvibaculum sp.]MBO6692144.1 hypothetical protein [Parvibaculum sp.]MBO6714134.1 hypothetical protein [Parvibaculum sp.]|tara:strand:- start:238 stop:579 length:342 start_codon:yes stop_codon:yes gene_type:complete